MHFLRELYTGVAICDLCGRVWELYRVRAEEAICRCGATLTCSEEGPELPVEPTKGKE